jgi:glycosyltransferase involved in cell wall biosynthesis
LDAKVTGVQRYTKSILEYFDSDCYREIAPSKQFSHGMKGHFWEQIILPGKLKKDEVLWSPSNAGPISVKNQVVSIHDLVPLDHPEWVSKTFSVWYKIFWPLLFKNARHFIAISEFTKSRMIEKLHVPEDKISVVHNGVESYFFDEPTFNYIEQIPFKRYILTLGAIEPRKNLASLLAAWKQIKSKVDDDIGLVVVGAKGDGAVFGDYSLEDDQERVFFTGYVDEKYIVSLYRNAIFFAYVSYYEGFGLPPLEAMATGCPVITSNITAMPEIVGEAGLLIDPFSSTSIQNAMLEYCNNSSLRTRNSILGIQRARNYDWKKCSEKTFKVLNQNF